MKSEHRIIVSSDGPYDNVLKLKPPMCFTKDNCDLFLDKLRSLLMDMKDRTYATPQWSDSDVSVSWQGPRAVQMKQMKANL